MSNFDKYLGLPYIEGRQDCYSIVRNYYRDEWGLQLPNLARPNRFWQDPDLDLYGMYRSFGFEQIFDQPLQIGDGLLMPLFTPFPTHAAVLCADNKILHHLPGRLSVLDDLRPHWSNKATIILRHPEVSKVKTKPKPTHLHEVADAQLFRNPDFEKAVDRALGTRG